MVRDPDIDVVHICEGALAFDQEQPEELSCGRREAVTILRRDPAKPSPATAREARRVEVAARREPAVDSWAVAT